MKKIVVEVPIERVKKRVYSFVSKVGARISNDREGFEKTSLTIDDDDFVINDNGLIDDVSLLLMKRLSAFDCWVYLSSKNVSQGVVEEKKDFIVMEINVPYREEELIHRVDTSYKQFHLTRFVEKLEVAVEQFYYRALAGEWLEMLGIGEQYPQFSFRGREEALDRVRVVVDLFGSNPNRTMISPLGF